MKIFKILIMIISNKKGPKFNNLVKINKKFTTELIKIKNNYRINIRMYLLDI